MAVRVTVGVSETISAGASIRNRITASVSINPSSVSSLKGAPTVTTVDSTYTYTITGLSGYTAKYVYLDNYKLKSTQWTQSGGSITITDTESDIYAGQELDVIYI
jgi:hypothetical protein